MKILTTVKRVTDPDMKVKIKPDGSGIVTDGVEYKMNSFDEYGVEEAIKLKEKHDAEVVVVSVGPQDATKEIRTALAMGADRGILVETDAVLDSDAVARVLAEVVRKENPDIIIMGKQAVDSDRNQAGQLLASYLDLPQATFAFSLDVADGWATVGRETDGGTTTVRVKLPAVVTADLRLNEPRYASLPGIMKAKRKQLDTLTPDALGVDVTPRVNVLKYEAPEERQAGRIVESVDELIQVLRNEAKVI
ncbi:electron transfer flavoprotein subunit beta/FixA family protein [Microvenator marinus]|uniref:Electron transfer flavoprotein subunit beta n=1 Tax=Microvenator marinus TaxID=2600177 RepID=A0A5B8Y0N3_9DELT|nr:electron transfer flavoprotein subunit beta/FixA family protein [Microvenator marinus]QED29219.1 electron transfer flavoprotein subunit beta/FixA family protein [Microvenator marinus]